MLADSLTELWPARLMTYQTAEAMDRGADVKVVHGQCSMAKLGQRVDALAFDGEVSHGARGSLVVGAKQQKNAAPESI